MTQGSSQSPRFSGDTAFDGNSEGAALCTCPRCLAFHVWGNSWLRLDSVAPVQGVTSDWHALQRLLGFTFCTQLKGSH